MNTLYSTRLIELATHISRLGRLSPADGSATKHAKFCGSTVTVDVNWHNGIITDLRQEVDACALGKAAAALFAQQVIGKSIGDVHALCASMRAFLEGKGPAPSAPWHGFDLFGAVQDYPQRHASVMLVFDAAVTALKEGTTSE